MTSFSIIKNASPSSIAAQQQKRERRASERHSLRLKMDETRWIWGFYLSDDSQARQAHGKGTSLLKIYICWEKWTGKGACDCLDEPRELLLPTKCGRITPIIINEQNYFMVKYLENLAYLRNTCKMFHLSVGSIIPIKQDGTHLSLLGSFDQDLWLFNSKKMLFLLSFWQSTQPTSSVSCCSIFPHENNKYMSSKASEILRALNSQIQHNPESTNSPAPVTQQLAPVQQSPAVSNQPYTSPLIGEIIQAKLQKTNYNSRMKYQENKEAPECLTEIFEKQIGTLISQPLFDSVESHLRQRQKNAYDSFTKGENQYLQVLLDQVKKKQTAHMDVVDNLLSARLKKVEGDLEKGSLLVNYERNLSNRRQLERLEKLDLARMIKIKDGQLRSKMDILYDKMEKFDHLGSLDCQEDKELDEGLHKKVMENIGASSYSLDSQRTKIAREYVHYMQQQRRSFEKRKKEREAKYEEEEKQRQKDLKQAQEMRDLAKHQEILQKIEIKRKKREEEEKEYEAKEEQAKKVLAQFHRKLPIFKIKEKEYQERIVKPQEKMREQKLKEIREYRKSMSLNEIKQHQQKYLTKLQQQKAKREEQFKLIMKSRKSRDKRQYYKGSAHARMEKMTKQDILRSFSLREASKLKVNRMRQYGQVIHKNHQPVVDEEKKKQLIKFIEDDLMKKRRARKMFRQVVDPATQAVRFQEYYEELPKKDLQEQGNKFFQEAKKYIKKKEKITAAEKIQELESQSNNNSRVNAKLLEPPSPQPQKKRSLWQIRAKQLKQLASSDVVTAKNFQQVKQNIENLDSKAAMKEDLLTKIQLPLQQSLKEKGMLDHFYLQSIHQKLRLLE